MRKTIKEILITNFLSWYKGEVEEIREEIKQSVPSEEISSSLGGEISSEVIIKSINKIIKKFLSWDTYEVIKKEFFSIDPNDKDLLNKLIGNKISPLEKGICLGLVMKTTKATKNVVSFVDKVFSKIGENTLYNDNSFDDMIYIFSRDIDEWRPRLKSQFNEDFKDFKDDISKEFESIINNTNIIETIDDWKFVCFFISTKLPNFYLTRKLKSPILDSDELSDDDFEKEMEKLEKLFETTNMESLKRITTECNRFEPIVNFMSLIIKNKDKISKD